MHSIDVQLIKGLDDGWDFRVHVDGHDFAVHVDRAYWTDLTNGEVEAESLVESSFRFLLDQEPVTSILRAFDLSVIEEYYPSYRAQVNTYYTKKGGGP